jgi:hypothetical protein
LQVACFSNRLARFNKSDPGPRRYNTRLAGKAGRGFPTP